MVETHDSLDMSGRTVIVTGGTKGLGRVIATRFLGQGADVVICARREPDNPVEFDGPTSDLRCCRCSRSRPSCGRGVRSG